MKIRKDYTCPLEIVHDIVKGKWKTIIMFSLKNGPASLADLQRSIEGISQKMLLEQLRELQEWGMVGKTKYPGYPLHVEYYLTDDKGIRMLDALKIMQQLGIEYMIENDMELPEKIKESMQNQESQCSNS